MKSAIASALIITGALTMADVLIITGALTIALAGALYIIYRLFQAPIHPKKIIKKKLDITI